MVFLSIATESNRCCSPEVSEDWNTIYRKTSSSARYRASTGNTLRYLFIFPILFTSKHQLTRCSSSREPMPLNRDSSAPQRTEHFSLAPLELFRGNTVHKIRFGPHHQTGIGTAVGGWGFWGGQILSERKKKWYKAGEVSEVVSTARRASPCTAPRSCT